MQTWSRLKKVSPVSDDAMAGNLFAFRRVGEASILVLRSGGLLASRAFHRLTSSPRNKRAESGACSVSSVSSDSADFSPDWILEWESHGTAGMILVKNLKNDSLDSPDGSQWGFHALILSLMFSIIRLMSSDSFSFRILIGRWKGSIHRPLRSVFKWTFPRPTFSGIEKSIRKEIWFRLAWKNWAVITEN